MNYSKITALISSCESAHLWKAAGIFANTHKSVASSGSNIHKHNLVLSFSLYFVIRLVILLLRRAGSWQTTLILLLDWWKWCSDSKNTKKRPVLSQPLTPCHKYYKVADKCQKNPC